MDTTLATTLVDHALQDVIFVVAIIIAMVATVAII